MDEPPRDEPPVESGPWVRRSRRTAYENPWLTIWHDEVDPPRRQPGHLRRRPLRERRRRRGRARRRRTGSCWSASIATRSTRTRGRSRRAACPTARTRSKARSASSARRPALEAARVARARPRRPLELGHRRGRVPLPRDRPDPRPVVARAERGARGPLGAVRRGPGDDARRPHRRRDERAGDPARGAARASAGRQ